MHKQITSSSSAYMILIKNESTIYVCNIENWVSFWYDVHSSNIMLTSNVKNWVSIKCITQKEKGSGITWRSYVLGHFLQLGDLYHVIFTSEQLKIAIFQLDTTEYPNFDTRAMTITLIWPYMYWQRPLTPSYPCMQLKLLYLSRSRNFFSYQCSGHGPF